MQLVGGLFDFTAPARPGGVVVTTADSALDVSWNAGTESDLRDYRVFVDGTAVAVVAKGTTTYRVSGLVNDRRYAITVSARDTRGNESTRSAAVNGTPRDLTAPAVPVGLTATRGDGQVTVDWAAGSDADLGTVQVWRDGVRVADVAAGTTRFVDARLVNDRTYAYRLVAVDVSGNASAPSGEVTATPTDLTPPAVPAGLQGVAGDASVTLTWKKDNDPDLAAVRVLQDDVVVAQLDGSETSWTGTGLEPGRSYRFRLVAVDARGNASAPSAEVTVVPVDLTAPDVPVGVRAVAGDGFVDLSWEAVTSADLARYEVRDATGTGDLVAVIPALEPGASVGARVEARVEGLANDVEVTYRVVAVDRAGNVSAPSEAVSATPRDTTAPAVPTGLRGAATDGGAQLTWQESDETDLATVVVLQDGVVVAQLPAGTTSWATGGLEVGRAYTFRLVAVDERGNASAPSEPVTVVPVDLTAPATPAGLTAVAGDGRVDLTWDPHDAVGDGGAEGDLAGVRVLRDGLPVAELPAGTTRWADTDVANDREYSYALVALDGAGNTSPPSAEVRVTPSGSTPPPFTGAVPPVAGTGSATGAGLAATRDGRWVVVATAAPLEASDTNTAVELYLVDRRAGASRRVAPLPAASRGATSDSTNTAAAALSEDGRYLVLSTTARLLPADTNTLLDVYRLDLRAPAGTPGGGWELVSVPAGGGTSAKVAGTLVPTGSSVYAKSPGVAVSADGRRVAFLSARADLVTGDRNAAADVFVKDMDTGAVVRASVTAAGAESPLRATGPALEMTPDGRYVLFPAQAPTAPLVAVRKDLVTGELRVASTMPVPGKAAREVGVFRDTGDLAISDDGRHVVFSSAAKPSAPATSWSTGLAYRADLLTGGLQALGTGQSVAWEHQVGLDPTGRYAFFATTAALVPADTNRRTDHYRRDLATGDLRLVTSRADGSTAPSPAGATTPAEYGPVLVLSGDRVLVGSVLPLVAGDTNRLLDVYGRDLATETAGSVVR